MTAPARRAGLIGWIRDEFESHRAFHIAFLTGEALWLLTPGLHPALRALLAADMFFVIFIALMMSLALRLDAEGLKRRAERRQRTGMGLITTLTFFAMLLSLWAIFLLLNHPTAEGRWFPALAVMSVPLAWGMTHILAAYHYASIYYTAEPGGEPARGMMFGGEDEPDALDLLYQAFMVGAAASSDVAVSSRQMRRAVMVHSLASFAYNTVLIAIAVNAAIILAGRLGS